MLEKLLHGDSEMSTDFRRCCLCHAAETHDPRRQVNITSSQWTTPSRPDDSSPIFHHYSVNRQLSPTIAAVAAAAAAGVVRTTGAASCRVNDVTTAQNDVIVRCYWMTDAVNHGADREYEMRQWNRPWLQGPRYFYAYWCYSVCLWMHVIYDWSAYSCVTFICHVR